MMDVVNLAADDEPGNVLQLEPHASAANTNAATPAEPRGISPAQMIVQWGAEGPLVRLPTGIAALDRLCRGGLAVPWRVTIVGAPSAGKTATATSIADTFARAVGATGACVGILAVDEEPEDVTVRLAQLAGFTVEQAEQREPMVLAEMAKALEVLRIRLYDASVTIDDAAADLEAWAHELGTRGALFIDSIQAVRSAASAFTNTAREQVEANVAAIRSAASKRRLLVVATSEANRAAYRSDNADQNDLAAGAESRAIEFGCQTMLVLRTPKGHPDVIHVTVAKNRRAQRGEFWLALDRETHALTECEDPSNNPLQAERDESQRRDRAHARLTADIRVLVRVALARPGLSTRDFRAAVRASGQEMGQGRFDAAKHKLEEGFDGSKLVNRGSAQHARWYVEAAAEGAYAN